MKFYNSPRKFERGFENLIDGHPRSDTTSVLARNVRLSTLVGKSKCNTFKDLKDKIWAKINYWSHKLSRACKETLNKEVNWANANLYNEGLQITGESVLIN